MKIGVRVVTLTPTPLPAGALSKKVAGIYKNARR